MAESQHNINEFEFPLRDSMAPVVCDVPSASKYEGRKVNQKHLSKLMRDILGCIDSADGIERGQLVASLYGLERRYCGHWTDPCMRPKELREYERLYRKKQPVITRTLCRLAKRGLVRLIRHGKYIKKIELTSEAKKAVEELV